MNCLLNLNYICQFKIKQRLQTKKINISVFFSFFDRLYIFLLLFSLSQCGSSYQIIN